MLSLMQGAAGLATSLIKDNKSNKSWICLLGLKKNQIYTEKVIYSNDTSYTPVIRK